MVLTAEVGLIRVGYQRAADIRNCTLTHKQAGLGRSESELIAIVTDIDDYWSTQRPLTLGIYMGGGNWWIWDRLYLVGDELGKGKLTALAVGGPVVKGSF